MKYLGLRRWALIVALVVTAKEFGSAIEGTFRKDFFQSCFTDVEAAGSFACEYGPTVLPYTIAAVVFLFLAYALLFKTTRFVKSFWAVIAMAIAVFVLMMFSTRLIVSVTTNFTAQPFGEETFTQNLLVLWINLEAFVVGGIIGAFYNIGDYIDRNAKPEKGRRAPREIWKAEWPKLKR